MKDSADREQCRARYLIQLGEEDVKLNQDAPQRTLREDSTRIVLDLDFGHTERSTWDYALSAGARAGREWLLHRAVVRALNVSPPSRRAGHTDRLQVIDVIPKSQLELALRASGLNGVFTRQFSPVP